MPDMPANPASSSLPDGAGGAGLRALIAKWRSGQVEYVSVCADELEAALSALPDVGEVRQVVENADGLREGSTVPITKPEATPNITPVRRKSVYIGAPALDVRTLREALIAARDTLAAFGKQAGWIPQQQGYSATMTEGEQQLARAVADIDAILAQSARLSVQEPRQDGWCSTHTFGSNVDPCPGCVKEAMQDFGLMGPPIKALREAEAERAALRELHEQAEAEVLRYHEREDKWQAERDALQKELQTYVCELKACAAAALTDGPIPGDEREHAGRWTMAEIIVEELTRLLGVDGGASGDTHD
jgi:hypothetical protein